MNFAFYVINDILPSTDDCQVYHFKSDYWATNYSSCFVFFHWKEFACTLEKVIIVYYGVCGHKKRPVDSYVWVWGENTIVQVNSDRGFFLWLCQWYNATSLWKNERQSDVALIKPNQLFTARVKENFQSKVVKKSTW